MLWLDLLKQLLFHYQLMLTNLKDLPIFMRKWIFSNKNHAGGRILNCWHQDSQLIISIFHDLTNTKILELELNLLFCCRLWLVNRNRYFKVTLMGQFKYNNDINMIQIISKKNLADL